MGSKGSKNKKQKGSKTDATSPRGKGAEPANTKPAETSSNTNNTNNTKPANTSPTVVESPRKDPVVKPVEEKKPDKKAEKKPEKGKDDAKNQENLDVFSAKRLEDLFLTYKEVDVEDREVIGPEGMTKLCEDLKVNPEDFIVLALAFNLNAQEMGYFTKQEFVEGLTKLKIDSIPKLKAAFPKMRSDSLDNQNKFKDLYKFTFNFAKEQEKKIIDMDIAKAFLKLVLAEKNFPHTSIFIEFLGEQKSYKVLNLDQWMSFLEFFRSDIKEDFSNYDANSAWPVILDEYAEWGMKRAKGENAQEAS